MRWYQVVNCLVFICMMMLSAQGSAASQQRVLLLTDANANAEVDISRHLLIIEDAKSELTLEQAIVAVNERGEFWTAPGFPLFGFSSSAYWASVTVDNNFNDDQLWYVRLHFSVLDRFDFFFQNQNGEWQQKSSGDSLPFNSRDVNHHAIMFDLPLTAGTSRTLYFRMQNQGSMQFPLSLLSADHYQAHAQVELLAHGLYLGMFALIAIYAMLMWVSTRDTSYLTFSLLLIFGSLYNLSFHGIAAQFLWPSSPRWADISVMVFIGLASAAGLQFSRTFIGTAALNKSLDKAIIGLIGVTLLYTLVTPALSGLLRSALIPILMLPIIITLSLVAWLGIKQGNKQARYFAAAFVVLMLGVVVELLQRMGINLPFPLNYHAVKVGSVVAATIVSLGFSGRVKELLEQYKSVQGNLLKANQQKIETLQRADDLKEEFIANISHELRTPLTGIIGLSDIMLGQHSDTLSAHDRETLTMIKVSGQRLANLINDVVDISAIKNGNLELHLSTVDLKAICKLIASMSRPFIGIKKIQLLESYPNEPVIVNGDEDRLQQILFNLVSNAIKFTVTGSVTLKIEVNEGNARVLVQDTGIGISKDEQKKIFNRFYQVDSAESRQQGGTGLGLAITNKLVQLHGTDLMLNSAEGEGATFYFELPMVNGSELKSVEPEEDRQQKFAEKRSAMMQMADPIQTRRKEQREPFSEKSLKVVSGKGRRILIVDDEYLNLRIVQEHLAADYELMLALSAHEALEILETKQPDLIITDLMMPVMDGFELCTAIRKKYRLDELPIIILTARNRVEDLVQGMSVGANDYISKPFSKEELKIRINKQFEILQLMEMKQENQRLYWQLEKYQDNEKHLRERENRFAKMLDVTGDAMLCIDESGLIIHLNKSAEALFGVKELDFQDKSLNVFNKKLGELSEPLAIALKFPFDEQKISTDGDTNYFDFAYNSDLTIGAGTAAPRSINVCILPLSLEQELYLLLFNTRTGDDAETDVVQLSTSSLPEIINEINKNVERTQMLRDYLNQITPEDLQKHKHLFDDLANVDEIIKHISDAIHDKSDDDLQYRETLVKLMQDCQYYWQKVTGQSIIELAEKSRIWTVSIDNGRLRTRSMNRYLALDKLPENPRWRQVARTAYFVLSKVSHDQEAKLALEKAVTRLQDIVEAKALN